MRQNDDAALVVEPQDPDPSQLGLPDIFLDLVADLDIPGRTGLGHVCQARQHAHFLIGDRPPWLKAKRRWCRVLIKELQQGAVASRVAGGENGPLRTAYHSKSHHNL